MDRDVTFQDLIFLKFCYDTAFNVPIYNVDNQFDESVEFKTKNNKFIKF
jgi:hypothetical protein